MAIGSHLLASMLPAEVVLHYGSPCLARYLGRWVDLLLVVVVVVVLSVETSAALATECSWALSQVVKAIAVGKEMIVLVDECVDLQESGQVRGEVCRVNSQRRIET